MSASARLQERSRNNTQSGVVFQDVSLVMLSGSTSCTSFVCQPALDFKGMITLSQVFRPRGANLIAQEGGVSALLYKDRYRVCVFMWASTEGELLRNLFTNYIRPTFSKHDFLVIFSSIYVEERMKSDAVSHVEYREMLGIDFLYLIFCLCR